MTPHRWQRVQELFEAALARPPDGRAEYLERACPDDAEIRQEVASLLDAQEGPGAVEELEGMLADWAASDAVVGLSGEERSGGKVGAYRIVRKLGEGGMGAVYLAEREGAGFEQRVALKLVRAGVVAPEQEARFLNERQILARLRHDGIARLIDGGLTERGVPFFAMEYVEGEPITAYAVRRRLSTDERLQLVADVCDAVAYAHQHLIVHRDLKPSNILVAESEGRSVSDARVKLLDFGIAKLLAEDAALPADVRTRTGHAVMTPAYAAPEQVRGDPVSTATDVYALGMVLYELLVGRRPYDVAGRSPADVERLVGQEAPVPPSAAERAGDARMPPSSGRLASDVDVIVLKALAKEPHRRYAGAAALGDDLRRHLAGFPIEARPDTLGYRLSTFVRRHRLGVAMATLLLLALVGGAAATAWQAQRATRALAQAQREAATAAEVSDFLVRLFEASAPGEARGDTLTAYDLLARGEDRVGELREEPLVRARLLTALGRTYNELGEYGTAQALLDSADHLHQRWGSEPTERISTLTFLAKAEVFRGRHGRADSLYAVVLDLQREHLGDGDPSVAYTLVDQAAFWQEIGRFEEAEVTYREALSRLSQHGSSERAAYAQHHLALLLQELGRFEEAAPLLREALAAQRKRLGGPHPELALLLNDYGMMLQRSGSPREAEPFLREALAMQRDLFGDAHPQIIYSLVNLATVVDDYDLEEADRLSSEAAALSKRILEPTNPVVANTMNMRAQVLQKQGRLDEALLAFEEALRLAESVFPPGHPRIGWARVGVGGCLLDLGRAAEAEPLIREGWKVLTEAFGAEHPITQRATERLAEALVALGRPDEAEALTSAADPAEASSP